MAEFHFNSVLTAVLPPPAFSVSDPVSTISCVQFTHVFQDEQSLGSAPEPENNVVFAEHKLFTLVVMSNISSSSIFALICNKTFAYFFLYTINF